MAVPAHDQRDFEFAKKFGLDIRTFEDALTFKLAMLVCNYIKYKK